MNKFLSIIVLVLFSLETQACVMPEFVDFGELGVVAIVLCFFIAVFVRAKTNRKRLWVPLLASALVSTMLLPYFYIFTPDYFYDNCGSGARETAVVVLVSMILIPLYEIILLIKQKFKQQRLGDAKLPARQR